MNLKPRVIVCADDFALTEGVSRGILDLADLGRISATSVMVTRPWWPRLAAELREREDRIGIGLHLNLTQGVPLGPMPVVAPNGALPQLGTLLPKALLGSLPQSELRDEIERQLVAFRLSFGRMPDFIDGHQHVHVLPGIRRALLFTLKRLNLTGKLWLRDPSDAWSAILRRGRFRRKAALVKLLALGFRRAARSAGFGTNQGFSGFSDFDMNGDLDGNFQRAFLRLGQRHLVMCHPGYVDAELKRFDSVVEPRVQELMYLTSERFADILEVLEVELVKSPA